MKEQNTEKRPGGQSDAHEVSEEALKQVSGGENTGSYPTPERNNTPPVGSTPLTADCDYSVERKVTPLIGAFQPLHS